MSTISSRSTIYTMRCVPDPKYTQAQPFFFQNTPNGHTNPVTYKWSEPYTLKAFDYRCQTTGESLTEVAVSPYSTVKFRYNQRQQTHRIFVVLTKTNPKFPLSQNNVYTYRTVFFELPLPDIREHFFKKSAEPLTLKYGFPQGTHFIPLTVSTPSGLTFTCNSPLGHLPDRSTLCRTKWQKNKPINIQVNDLQSTATASAASAARDKFEITALHIQQFLDAFPSHVQSPPCPSPFPSQEKRLTPSLAKFSFSNNSNGEPPPKIKKRR